MADGGSSVVCVTGATGFIAGHICQRLLSAGVTVRGTVRSIASAGYLKKLDGACERLQLFEADLMKPGSFDEAVSGCSVVYHIASPVILQRESTPEEVVIPAEQGTLNVLESCAKAGVKRVVATASFATIIFARDHTKDSTPYTDKDWNEYSRPWPGDTMNIYRYSKVAAEKAAWKYVQEKKPSFDLITINPPMVIGPYLPGYTRANDSSLVIKKFVSGESNQAKKGGMGWIDVRDVARVHILAGETPTAKGRYLINTESFYWRDICKVLADLFPEHPVTQEFEPGDDLKPEFDTSRTKADLKFEPKYAIRDSLGAQTKALIDLKLI